MNGEDSLSLSILGASKHSGGIRVTRITMFVQELVCVCLYAANSVFVESLFHFCLTRVVVSGSIPVMIAM